MATITIRNLPEDTRDALKARAIKAGRSLEAEVRQILASAAREPRAEMKLEERFARVRAKLGPSILEGPSLADELIRERRAESDRE